MNGMKDKFDTALKRIGDEIDKDQAEQDEKNAGQWGLTSSLWNILLKEIQKVSNTNTDIFHWASGRRQRYNVVRRVSLQQNKYIQNYHVQEKN